MGHAAHLIRRGERYSWRRTIRGVTVQIPLNTRCPREARAAAAEASVRAFDMIEEGRADRAAARELIFNAARINDKEAKKDKRHAFTSEDVAAIFSQPALSPDGRRDALFWIAHAAPSLARAGEEIAGLDVSDVVEKDGVPCLHVRVNAHRPLKTLRPTASSDS